MRQRCIEWRPVAAHAAADRVGDRFRRSLVRHMHHVDARHDLQLLEIEVRAAADPGRGKVQLAGIRFRRGYKVGERLPLGVLAGDQHVRPAAEQREVGEVLQRIVGKARVDARVGDVRGRVREQRVAIGRRVYDHLRADRAAGTGAVFGDHRLAPDLLQLCRECAADDVGGASGRECDDQANGLRRVVLCERIACDTECCADRAEDSKKAHHRPPRFRVRVSFRTPAPAGAAM